MSIRTTTRIGKLLALATVLFCAGMFTGCGNFFQAITTTTTTTNTGTGFDLVYAGKNGSSSFVGYSIAAGGLTQVTGSPFSIGSPPLAMAINPADTYLYVGTAAGIYGYSIAAGGALTTLSSGAVLGSFATGISPAAMDISPDGNYLAVLTNTSTVSNSVLYVYLITSTTGLLGTPQSITTNGLGSYGTGTVQGLKFSPIYSSSYVLGASYGTGGETIYSYNPSGNGTIAAVTGYTPPSAAISDNGIAFNAAGTSLIVVRGGGASSILSYTITPATGSFSCSESTFIAGSPVTAGNNPTAISFNNTTTQPYLYVTNTTDDTISGYSVTTNTTTPVTSFTALGSPSPYATLGGAPAAIAFDNTGTWMLAMNQTGPPDLIQYTVDTVVSPGRLYVTGSVFTGLSIVTASPGITMVTTH